MISQGEEPAPDGPMQTIDHANWSGYLDSNEKLLWTGRPHIILKLNAHSVFPSLFGICFLSFTLFWGVSFLHGFIPSPINFIVLMVFLLFLTVGMWLTFGYHIWMIYQKRRTRYALTNKRALVLTAAPRTRLASYGIDARTNVEIRPGRRSSILFATRLETWWGGPREVGVGFEDIDEGQFVYRLIREMQQHAD